LTLDCSPRSGGGDLHASMAENRELLAERGQKLERLQDRTAQMENDAQDFASMARRIADQEKHRKWWQV
jgi:syntaxin-binding protein 5